MSSVRPKLKHDAQKAVTAWDTATGGVVWMTQDGGWTADSSEIGVFAGDEAEARLAEAESAETLVNDPYFMEITPEGGITGRETLRERIRAEGPTSHPEFSKIGGR
ncbi:MAG: DUF2849 domain-containing protein [Pseudomonadota bacterium]